jgi:hypothetical protein
MAENIKLVPHQICNMVEHWCLSVCIWFSWCRVVSRIVAQCSTVWSQCELCFSPVWIQGFPGLTLVFLRLDPVWPMFPGVIAIFFSIWSQGSLGCLHETPGPYLEGGEPTKKRVVFCPPRGFCPPPRPKVKYVTKLFINQSSCAGEHVEKVIGYDWDSNLGSFDPGTNILTTLPRTWQISLTITENSCLFPDDMLKKTWYDSDYNWTFPLNADYLMCINIIGVTRTSLLSCVDLAPIWNTSFLWLDQQCWQQCQWSPRE